MTNIQATIAIVLFLGSILLLITATSKSERYLLIRDYDKKGLWDEVVSLAMIAIVSIFIVSLLLQ